MKAPFPYIGGKSSVASLIWQRFGNPANYIEPFAGSLAVLLARPSEPGIETVNDADGMIANFWRALRADPDCVAYHADWPVNENDLHARHSWLVNHRQDMTRQLEGDPDWYDAKAAGWWVWGASCWIAGGWCAGVGPWRVNESGELVKTKCGHTEPETVGVNRQLPHLGNAGRGVKRKLPHLGDAGMGVKRKLPHAGDGSDLPDTGLLPRNDAIYHYLRELSARLAKVRVCCGDWSRICGDAPTVKNGLTAVFFDPPYSHAERDTGCYAVESDIAHDVREWAIANGDNPLLRICLCGYEGEHDLPDSWECVAWKAQGGYGHIGDGRGAVNAHRERLWFSPHCLKTAGTLFDYEED